MNCIECGRVVNPISQVGGRCQSCCINQIATANAARKRQHDEALRNPPKPRSRRCRRKVVIANDIAADFDPPTEATSL